MERFSANLHERSIGYLLTGEVRMRILIIEDEPKMAKLLKKGLQEENHSVMVAHDGMEGFDMSRTDEFDAVVLDVMLPGMTGFEIARRLRDSNSQVPILMLTARDAVAYSCLLFGRVIMVFFCSRPGTARIMETSNAAFSIRLPKGFLLYTQQ